MFNNLFAIILKDLLIEIRSRETVISMLTLALLLSVLCSIGVHGAFLEPKSVLRIFPTLLLISFIFASTISITRSLHYEFELRAIDGIMTTGTSTANIYISKVLVNSVATSLSYICIAWLLTLFLDLNISNQLPLISLVGVAVSIGYSSLSTLFGAIVLGARLRDLLLPLILIPLLFPIFFAAHELTMQIVTTGALNFESPWLTLLSALDLIYLILGVNLFDFVVRG